MPAVPLIAANPFPFILPRMMAWMLHWQIWQQRIHTPRQRQTAILTLRILHDDRKHFFIVFWRSCAQASDQPACLIMYIDRKMTFHEPLQYTPLLPEKH
jgi:hypothetical protein